jgi:4-amino-4-deoxy-L-arabinose transferase-like glycosyltransferase
MRGMTFDQASTFWLGRVASRAQRDVLRGRVLGLPWPLATFMAIQTVFWTVMPTYVTKSMHASSAELVMWGRDWFWLNFKHPALASWVMDLAYAVFGIHLWVVYFVGQAFLCATYVFVYLLGRALLDEKQAAIAPMLVAGLTYFTVFALRFNHNLVQMPFWAAFAYWLWKASESNKRIWWVLAAMAAALGIYGKFSTAIPVALGCAWILADARTRRHLKTVPPYIGLVVFLAMLAPLLTELVRTHFMTIAWVSQESEDKGVRWTSYYRHQGEYLLRILVLAAAAGAIGFRARSTAAMTPDEVRKRAYLVLMGAGPLGFTFVLAPFMDLRNAWSVPMFSLMGLVLLAFWPRAVSMKAGARTMVVALAVSIAMGAQFAWEQHLNFAQAAEPGQYSYPARHIAAHFGKIWRHQTHAPLMIVGGDSVTASLAGLNSHWQPSMFADLDPRESPSMNPARIRREGMLLVWRIGEGDWQPAPEWLKGRTTGVEAFRWSKSPNARLIRIGYAIIPPGATDVPAFGAAN